MKTKLNTSITIQQLCHGFVYNELEGKGLFGLSGKLTIQPEYQRNYIYQKEKKRKQSFSLFLKVILLDLFILIRQEKKPMRFLMDSNVLQVLEDS